MKDQELAEKRRVAPGWLDRTEKILEPKRSSVAETSTPPSNPTTVNNIIDQYDEQQPLDDSRETSQDTAGDELDRAFGGMGLRNG